MHVTLVVRQGIPLWDVRRNKLWYLVEFSARSKYCNPQTQRLVELLFCSTLECPTLLYQEVVLSLMTYLMKFLIHLPQSYSGSRMLGVHIDVVIKFS